MSSLPLRALAFVALSLMVSACGRAVGPARGAGEVGKLAPPLTIHSLNGMGAVSLDAMSGKVAIVQFWATWCEPCKKSLTQLEQLGFCSAGTGFLLERDGAWEMEGGQVAVCPSGGTLCTNPIAVAGLVRAIEAANQVMGTAGAHQVRGVRNAIATAVGGIAQFLTCSVFSTEPHEEH